MTKPQNPIFCWFFLPYKFEFFIISYECVAAAKLSIEEFYQVAPTGKLHAADLFHRHPERIAGSNKITPYLENISTGESMSGNQHGPQPSPNLAMPQKSPHVRRAKWHLGIRSQSRP
ncbi:unnamed protein product, partial [Gongylonema pulchrum]|uniref:Uncharacterized protein n=1 Tax=Gongylonema pulchrum TaxID=637853 RepID=A0A183DLL5_9BILA